MDQVIDLKPMRRDVGVIDTPTHRKIHHALEDALLHMRVAVIRGGFGVGKTFAIQSFVTGHLDRSVHATLNAATSSMTAGLATVCGRVYDNAELVQGLGGLSRTATYHGWVCLGLLRRVFKHASDRRMSPLLIVDEAQHARPDLLDALRGLYDEGVCGLVIAGNERLFNPRRGRVEAADFGALLSRAHHVIDIPRPTGEDIDAMLDTYRIVDNESRALLSDCAAAGGLREIVHVVEKAREISGSPLVGYKHLKAAAATTGLLSASSWGRAIGRSRR